MLWLLVVPSRVVDSNKIWIVIVIKIPQFDHHSQSCNQVDSELMIFYRTNTLDSHCCSVKTQFFTVKYKLGCALLVFTKQLLTHIKNLSFSMKEVHERSQYNESRKKPKLLTAILKLVYTCLVYILVDLMPLLLQIEIVLLIIS